MEELVILIKQKINNVEKVAQFRPDDGLLCGPGPGARDSPAAQGFPGQPVQTLAWCTPRTSRRAHFEMKNRPSSAEY